MVQFSSKHFHQFDTLLYFLMQNITAVLSISIKVANFGIIKKTIFENNSNVRIVLLTYAFVYIFIVILFFPAVVSDPF